MCRSNRCRGCKHYVCVACETYALPFKELTECADCLKQRVKQSAFEVARVNFRLGVARLPPELWQIIKTFAITGTTRMATTRKLNALDDILVFSPEYEAISKEYDAVEAFIRRRRALPPSQ